MTQAITNISVEVLKVHPRNAEFFDDISGEEYERFKKSIQDDGLLSPLIVAPDMTIISGHQRLKACKELGYKTIPVIIKDDLEDEDEKLKKLIAANFGRLKNDPVKQGKLIKEYERLSGVRAGSAGKGSLERHNVSLKQEDIARELGVDVKTIQRLKQLADLPQEFQDLISDGVINPTTGYKLLTRLTDEEQTQLLSQLPVAKKLTQAQVQAEVDKIKAKQDLEVAALRASIKQKEGMLEDVQAQVERLESEPVSTDDDLIAERDKYKQEKRDEYEKRQAEKTARIAAEQKASQLEKEKNDLAKAKAAAEKDLKSMEGKLERAVQAAAKAEDKAFDSQSNATIIEKVVEVVPEEYKQKAERLAKVEKELAELKARNRKDEDDHVMLSINCDVDQDKFSLQEAQRLQEMTSAFAFQIQYFELTPEVCWNMPQLYKDSITKSGNDVIDRIKTIFRNLHTEGDYSQCKERRTA